jgi:ABC-type glutathione transport system ATPase component
MSRRGKDEANHDLQIADILPLAVLDECVAVVGTSGAGKTYAPAELPKGFGR